VDGFKQLKGMGFLDKQVLAYNRTVWLPGADLLPFFQNFQIAGTPRSGATTTTTMEEEKEDKSVVVVDSTQIAGTPRSGNQVSGFRTSGIVYQERGVTFEKNLAMCRKMHIGEPKASQISLLEWASPDLIKAHVNDLMAGETIGLAIRRIEGNETPRSWEEEAREIATQGRSSSQAEQVDVEEDREAYDLTGRACLWQDELEEVFGPNHQLAGLHMRGPMCHKPCRQGSMKWCEEHYEIGTKKYRS